MKNDLVLLEISEHVAIVTLNRPEKLNALNTELRDELDECFIELSTRNDVHSVVLTGAGRAFSAGADLSGGGMPRGEMEMVSSFDEMAKRQMRMLTLPQPVIAAVNGYCLGRGMEMALWCDAVLAAESARFGQPEVRDGSLVASIVPWLVNPQRAKLIMLTGDTIDASSAYEMGLIARVVPGDDALPAAVSLARRIAHVPGPTSRAVKRYVNNAADLKNLVAAQEFGNVMGALLHALPDEELGEEHLKLLKIRETDGLKAYLAARDAPYAETSPTR